VVSEDDGKRRTLADCITEYLDEIRITHTPATHAAYSLALRDFANSCSKIHIEDIDRSDLLHYIHYSREELRLARTQVLELCRAVARRAGLNPENFWLHKFRATFATRHLQKGVDLRTVQDWLGHKDLESTMRYLQPAKGKAVRQKVNATFSAVAGGVR